MHPNAVEKCQLPFSNAFDLMFAKASRFHSQLSASQDFRVYRGCLASFRPHSTDSVPHSHRRHCTHQKEMSRTALAILVECNNSDPSTSLVHSTWSA